MSSKKVKSRVSKLIEKSDSEIDDDDHELSFYINDRVKLMKEVLKIIKPKKIKGMAPDCIKDLDIEEVNSMLLEELLGISNKRLKYIFSGQNPPEDSSSTDTEEDVKPIDIISLDDVSDDDFIIVDSDTSKNKKHSGTNHGPKRKKIKKEKLDKTKSKDGPLVEENLMSVLELLELQARARAIRSQLLLEANKKPSQSEDIKIEDDDDDVIIEIPKDEEIVIDSSDSESGQKEKSSTSNDILTDSQRKKITLIRDRFDKPTESDSISAENSTEPNSVAEDKESEAVVSTSQNISQADTGEKDTQSSTDGTEVKNKEQTNSSEHNCETIKAQELVDDDEIILIVDQDEMEGMMGE